MDITVDKVLLARDRIREILNMHIAPLDALERANNIAQVLAYDTRDPICITLDMLAHLSIHDPFGVATKVNKVWTTVCL